MIYEHEIYKKDLETIANVNLPWKNLKGKTILITGARGMIGSFLIDVLMLRNELFNDDITVYAIGRNKEKAESRFSKHVNSGYVKILEHDINNPLWEVENIDYIIHGASNTHPSVFGRSIGTITTNVFGTYNLLDFAVENNVKRFMLLSTVEVYGEIEAM